MSPALCTPCDGFTTLFLWLTIRGIGGSTGGAGETGDTNSADASSELPLVLGASGRGERSNLKPGEEGES